ncbi:MAG: alkaline phosphatase [Bryobacteraceae bacterium]|nr:alkaline phosphatase [Bryobacteraceae bacterium]
MLVTRMLLALYLTANLLPAQLKLPKPKARAKNVIVFLADAGGIPTLNAASLVGYGEPQKLFVQSWPSLGLSDTSTASSWVTDSAAGMTAIVTGQKTHNGVISMGAETVRGKSDGPALKTILEYAEERGLSTGVVSNVSIADATPAACYGHANDRALQSDLYLQIFSPKFGDGVDVVLGGGRKTIYAGAQKSGKDLDAVAAEKKRPIYAKLSDVPATNARPLVLLDNAEDVPAMANLALDRLARNPKGYFLMIEWDAHTDNPEQGLNNLVNFDKLIREIAGKVDLRETLLLFTADHSFELRTVGGKRGEPLLKGFEEWKQANHARNETVVLPAMRVGHSHTGEEVLATAIGPGAERVQGFFPNTHLFNVLMSAYGWQPTKP